MRAEVVAPVAAGQLRVSLTGPGAARQLVDGPLEPAHCPQPTRDVPAPIAPRQPPTPPYAEVEPSSGAHEFLGDLAARLAAADDEHRSGRQGRWVAVGVGVDLRDAGRQLRRAARD